MANQRISISYGDFTIDNTNQDKYLINKGKFTLDYDEDGVGATLRFLVIVFGSDEGGTELFLNQKALEDAFLKIRKTVAVSFQGNTYRTFETLSGGATAQDSVAKLTPLDDEWATNKSHQYSVAIRIKLPAQAGAERVSESISILEDASQLRNATISATYRSSVSTNAKSQVETLFDTFCSSVLLEIPTSGAWDISSKPDFSYNPITKNLATITAVYREYFYPQAVTSGILDPNYRDVVVSSSFSTDWAGDTKPSQSEAINIKRDPVKLIGGTISISLSIKRGLDMVEEWEDQIRPFLVALAKEKEGFKLIAVVGRSLNLDETNWKLSGSIQVNGATQGNGQIINSSISVSLSKDPGNLIIDAHDGTDYGAFVIGVKKRLVKVINETWIELSPSTGGGGGGVTRVGIGVNGRLTFNGSSNPFSDSIGFFDKAPSLKFIPPNQSGGGGGDTKVKDKGEWVQQGDTLQTEPQVVGNYQVNAENFQKIQRSARRTMRWVTPWKRTTFKTGAGG